MPFVFIGSPLDQIFQTHLPPEMQGDPRLPGIGPCGPEDWLRVDETYAGQLAYRAHLIATAPETVIWCAPDARPAAREMLEEALAILPSLGFAVDAANVTCPDGRVVRTDFERPLYTLGHLLQEDICILQKQGDEHVLTAAVLCFPASWSLAEKVGRPLTAIHTPVAEYDGNIANRVQRLFDGVQVGRPLWRFNKLMYVDSDLHQPSHRMRPNAPVFLRSERQCILRLPKSEAVVFTIHTWVLDQFHAGI